MSDNTDKNKDESATKDSAEPALLELPTVLAAMPAVAGKSFPGWWLWIFSSFLALVAIAGSAYVWQQSEAQVQRLDLQQSSQQQTQAELSESVKRVDAQLSVSLEKRQSLDKQNLLLVQQQADLRRQLDSLRAQLASQQQRLLSLSTTDRADWLLAEADYLMRLANQRLLMGREIDGAFDLLAAADEIMKELNDAALFPVRNALAGSMMALKTAASFDREGIYLQIAALANAAEQLRMFKLPELTIGKSEEVPKEDWQQRLQSGFTAALYKLSSYVSYKNRTENYKPLLAPEYESAVRQNLRLMLEQAQMALLSGKQNLFELSLNKANYWLSTYYILDEGAVDSLKNSIDKLLHTKIEFILPDISAAPRALKIYMDTIHQLPMRINEETKSTIEPDSKGDTNDKEAGESAQ